MACALVESKNIDEKRHAQSSMYSEPQQKGDKRGVSIAKYRRRGVRESKNRRKQCSAEIHKVVVHSLV